MDQNAVSIAQQGVQSQSKKHGILKTMMSHASAARRNTAKLVHYHENPGEALNKTGTEVDQMTDAESTGLMRGALSVSRKSSER